MIFVQSKEELDDILKKIRKNSNIISLVPTMGNLHAGHLSLIKIAKKNSTKVVTSIFINPLQFGKNEDYNDYPRTIESDKRKLEKLGCDILFYPKSNEEIFPKKQKIKLISSGDVGKILCGRKRPGHFDGVLTVVYKLFSIIKPNLAVFGAKDYQQQFLIRKMSINLFPDLKIITGKIIRDRLGLALSSRNNYLSYKEKQIAPFFFKSLQSGYELYKTGKNFPYIIEKVKNLLISEGFDVDYLEIRNTELKLTNFQNRDLKNILLGSVKLGETRLIDNIEFN